MHGRAAAAVVLPLTVLAWLGAYAWADAADLVPGWITTAPEPVAPAQFLTSQAIDPAVPPPVGLAPLSSGDAPLPDSSALTALAQALRDDARTGTSTNVSVVDVITGQVLVDLDAADPQVPASVTKVLTAIAVVSALGPDHQLQTQARLDATGTIVTLVAGGDNLLAADAGHGGSDPTTANGYAGVGDLADQIVADLSSRGVTDIELRLDTSSFPGPAYPSEWPAYAIQRGYAAPVTGLAIDVGRKTEDNYAQRWPDPAQRTADVLAQRLGERGVTVTRIADGNAGGDVVASVASAPLWQVTEYMLARSDNTIAEVLTRVLAVHAGRDAIPAEAMDQVRLELVDLGVDVSDLTLHDGAGFSVRNRIPPAVLTDALVRAAGQEATRDIFGWLAIGALEGTVDDRFVDAPAAGLVRAKTGSLTGVTALTGVVFTAEGRPLAFAVLADGMPYGQDRPRAAIDEFINALAQCGCEG